ncbi:tRNA-splicing endonuclease [Nanobdella aerobiophila]|uniref:tRNA-splicing endonuclease n=1 Tax=Nanobdella aerobiophila TaxID=2586965 RepID=A0A915SSU2_9ARCH|nr:hypothetical protein [Nanobdella aerobiophila]BBL45606.1 tRNA-splicing endonuclease [Nanobdella aerobiophila]
MEKAIIKLKDNKFVLEKNYYDKIGRIGYLGGDYIYLEPEEVLYILKKGWAKLDNIRNFVDFIEKYNNIIDFKKYYVFEDLRDKGYNVKIKDKFILLNNKEFIYTIYEYEFIEIDDIISIFDKYNITSIILAILDIERNIIYYEIDNINI